MTTIRIARPLAAALALAALPLTATTAAAQDYFFRIPHVTSANEPVHEALEHFAALIEERSGGRIEAEVFPGGQLGTNLEMYEQVDLGAEIIILADPGYLSNFMPDWGILNGPYLLDAPEDFQKIVASDWYAGMVGELRDTTNLELLALNWFFGDRNVISDTEVRTVDDFQGLSIRVPPNPMWIATFDALGARGEQIAWAEVYGALASGVVDAAEAPLGSIYGASLQENASTISMTGHFYAWIGLAMNDELYASMPEDLQEVLSTSAIDAGNFMTELVQSKQGEFIETLEAAGITFVTDVDRAGMREATIPVYSAFPDWSDGLVETVQAILAE
jgi:tripartite ATP-independent transporter DctP family solute receptor